MIKCQNTYQMCKSAIFKHTIRNTNDKYFNITEN